MRRVVTDRTFTVALPSGQGPSVIPLELNLPDIDNAEIIAWIGNFGSSNVYLLESRVALPAAQARISDSLDTVDCIAALSGSAVITAPLDESTRAITVFFENANTSGQTESVSIRVRGFCE